MKRKIDTELNKILTPISQDLLAAVIKLKRRTGKITVKSIYDNKKYQIEIHIRNSR